MREVSGKFGQLDLSLNFFSKILFVVMVSLSGMLIILRGFSGTFSDNLIIFFKYFLLLSSIIPISMRVNLDFAKLVYKYLIDHDK
jgi:phospholipid-translocating ATPase